MRINLMDGSLNSLGGHPHDIDLRVTRTLVEAGHDVHVYAHERADSVLQSHYQGLAPLQPLFSIDPYVVPDTFDGIAGDIIKNLEGARVTAQELSKTRPADLWLWPSFYPHQLLACAFFRPTAKVSGCIHHPPDFFSSQDTAWWRYGFMQSHSVQMKLKVGFIEPETRYPYTQMVPDDTLQVFPFPNDGVPPKLHDQMKKIGIFGFQRWEKGFQFFHSLIGQLLANGYEVVMQNSNAEAGSFNEQPGLVCLGHVMDLDEEIARCDLVLAPYELEAYRYRGSGIVMSALACGVPVVVPLGTAPGRLIEKNGAGMVFTQFTLPSILAAVQNARDSYPIIAEAAYGVAREWKHRHGVTRFVQAMIMD